MADTPKKTPEKIGKLVYPFKKRAEAGKTDAKPTEVDDARIYFDALSRAYDGFYPIGANGQWHGGVHFDSETGATLQQDDGIRCIGAGEVVAYQVESKYSTVDYSIGKATYSRSFVLVRHRLELPAAPKAKTTTPAQESASPAAPSTGGTPANTSPATSPTNASEAKAEEPSLIFYSAYLHLLDWDSYSKLDANKPRPEYWGDGGYLVGERCIDTDRTKNTHIPEAGGTGINLHAFPQRCTGFAPRGVKLKLGEAHPDRASYFKIVEVTAGTTYPADVVGMYVYKGTAKTKEGLTPLPAEPEQKDSVYVLPKPAPIKAGELIGYLGRYDRYLDAKPLTTRSRALVQLDVFTTENIKDFIAKSRERAKLLDAKQKTLLKVDKGAKLALPSKPDLQIAASEGVAVTGKDANGTWIQVRRGTLQSMEKQPAWGKFTVATRSYAGGQVLHRMLGADDSDSISYEDYEKLGKEAQANYTRRQVLTPNGPAVWIEKSKLGKEKVTTGQDISAWSQFPLKVGAGNGPTANYIRVAQVKQLSKVITEADGTRWWEVDVGVLGGGTSIGWAREKDHPQVSLCSPWDWPGFEIIEGDTSTPEDLYKRHINSTKQDRQPDEQAAMAAKAAEVNGGPLFSKLCEAIDLDKNDVLTPDELRKALKQPWQADALSRLIIHHTSEWGTSDEEWKTIDAHIPANRKADWEQEKLRIRSLQWWGEIDTNPALPGNKKSYSFHPMSLVNNFLIGTDECSCGCCIGAVFERTSWVRKRSGKPDVRYYGPIYRGTKGLNAFTGWEDLISSGHATNQEKEIVIAMSSNEGNMDAVQAWDWQTLSAGAMQKTVTPEGYGELPRQILEFSTKQPELYNQLFVNCGWSVEAEASKARIYYESEATNYKKITGQELYEFIKSGFGQFDSASPKRSKPLASIAYAIINDEYQKKQVIDFIGRIRDALDESPIGYSSSAGNYFQSSLGRALVLDHSVNAPGNVRRSLKLSIDRLISNHPGLSSDPTQWGIRRAEYEQELIRIYGPSRAMVDAEIRYNHLREKL